MSQFLEDTFYLRIGAILVVGIIAIAVALVLR